MGLLWRNLLWLRDGKNLVQRGKVSVLGQVSSRNMYGQFRPNNHKSQVHSNYFSTYRKKVLAKKCRKRGGSPQLVARLRISETLLVGAVWPRTSQGSPPRVSVKFLATIGTVSLTRARDGEIHVQGSGKFGQRCLGSLAVEPVIFIEMAPVLLPAVIVITFLAEVLRRP